MRHMDLKRAVQQKPQHDDCFGIQLIRLICKAKGEDRAKLAKGFPVEVKAVAILEGDDCPHLNKKRTHIDFRKAVQMAEGAK